MWLASGASGKALAAYPGLGLVFSGYRPEPDAALPRYLDLGLHCAGEDSGAVPFTLSSNLLAALDAGLARQSDALLSRVDREGRWLRRQLRDLGFTLVATEEESAGAVTTIALPVSSSAHQASTGHGLEAQEMGRNLEAHGFYTSYASGYLRQRNWLQICLMGDTNRGQLERLLPVLAAELDRMTRVGAAPPPAR